jgi:murein DD-endopeptidase MepM/ murein hydrolase activator NlpD
MDNKKVTVLIISSDNNETKSFEIEARHVKNFRKYIKAIFVFGIFCMVGLIGLFAHIYHINSRNNELNGQLADADKQIELVAANKVKEKLSNIDQTLSKINTYLHGRGALADGNVGGENSKKEGDVYSELNFYEEQSVVFLNTLENTPTGFPYNGPVSSGYGYRTNPFGGRSGEFHPGIDFKGQIGDPIYATASGFVQRCDWYNGYGNAVVITHENGLQTLFGHMSRVNVVQGQKVAAGDLIGFLGTTGRSTGPHVHYEIRRDGDDIDPVPFLKIN